MARYTKQILLGSGSYGNAWVVEKNDSKQKMVMKEVSLKYLDKKSIDQALTEVEALAGCKHENVVRYSEAFVESGILSIVMEYASGGDLHQCISKRHGLYFPNETIFKWLYQLVDAVGYIHQKGILHRDIKPQNLFLTSSEDLKLGDFGICRILQDDHDAAQTFIGTPFYLSPEICRQERYNQKSDMWACGCVLYELCALRVPFTADNLPALMVLIEGANYPPLPSQCGRVLTTLVDRLLTPDPKLRPSACQVLNILSARRSGLDRKRPISNSPIDSRTYTVHRPPKVPRMSHGSPELSALLERQRSMSLRSPRAFSVDAIRPQKHIKKGLAPKMNLMQELNVDKWKQRDMKKASPRCINEALYQLTTAQPSQRETALRCLHDKIEQTVGVDCVTTVKKAVENGRDFSSIEMVPGNKEGDLQSILSLIALEMFVK